MGDGSLGDLHGAVADRLAERHFTMQDANAQLPNLEVMTLDPSLRGLLFTDGTVTRALEAQTLCRVVVDVVAQSRTTLPSGAAHYLEIDESAECLCRRVTMKTSGPTPVVWAESHILPERLPMGFLGLLGSAPNGIGGSIEQAKLESRRELLWFRLDTPPEWASTVPPCASTLVRLYRIITNDRPALLIREAFAVERQLGVYRPLGWRSAAMHATSGTALSASE
ncbi:MAG TPA: chorismate pyruvate-lyase family protein [Solirubrobacteraceae bacterium]